LAGIHAGTQKLHLQKPCDNDETTVVDISSAADFTKGHLSGSKNIVMSRINDSDPEVSKITAGPVLVVCKNGNSAHQAAARFVKLGTTDVAVLKGGTTQWLADQFPLARK